MAGNHYQSDTEDTNSEIRKTHFLGQEKRWGSIYEQQNTRAFKSDLDAALVAQNYIPVNYGSGFRDIASLENLFLHYKENTKIIKIIQQGSSQHLDPIEEETRKSDLDTLIPRGNHRSSHSVLNSSAIKKAISKDIDHRWELSLTI